MFGCYLCFLCDWLFLAHVCFLISLYCVGNVLFKGFIGFLAHLSRKLKRAFLIARCSSSVWSSSPKPLGQFRLNLAQSMFVQMKGHSLFQEKMIKKPQKKPKNKCTLTRFKYFLKKNMTNFNQTWHKTSLVEGDPSLYKWGQRPFPRGDNNEIA